MQLARCLVLGAAYLALLGGPSFHGSPKLLPLSEEQTAVLLRFMKWILALWLVREVNAVLNSWAENRWRWGTDKNSWDWEKEVAVVTGGSSGIGAMLVKRLLSYGVTVVVLDVEPLSEDFLPNERRLVSFYHCDVSSRDAVHAAAEAIRSDQGAPSILVNNAGIGNASSILEVSTQRLRTMFNVNIISHWNTVQEFLPDMIAKRKGHIMSTSSMSAFFALAGAVDYASTKAGLIAFHEGLTQELKHRYRCPEIKTSIVYPTWTRTRLIAAIERGIQTMRAPIMDTKDVADAMANQILAAKSGQLILGPSIATAVRAFPIWVQELIRDNMAQVVTVNATTAVASTP